MQIIIQTKQFLFFTLYQPAYRNVCPARHNRGYILFVNGIFTQTSFAFLSGGIFGGLQLGLKFRDGAMAQFRSAVEVILTFSGFEFGTGGLDAGTQVG